MERRRRRELSATNSPKAFQEGGAGRRGSGSPEKDNGSRHASRNNPVEKRNGIRVCGQRLLATRPPATESRGGTRKKKDKGGDSAWDPPLPIPNREVKPRRADGTAKAGEQVAAPLMKRRGPGTQVQGPLPFFMPGLKSPCPGRRHNDAGCKPRWVAAVNFNVQGDGNVWITSETMRTVFLNRYRPCVSRILVLKNLSR